MQQLGEDLYIAVATLRFAGIEMGARMTIVRLANGELVLHSPIAATPKLVEEVSSLGQVAYLLAPNKLHHLYVGEWKASFPLTKIYAAPGLETKRADLAIEGLLGDEPEPAWANALDQTSLDGFPFANEIVFFHRASRTLIASDLAFNIDEHSPFMTRACFRLAGTFGRLAPTLVERVLVRDRAAFGQALTRIFEWPFERVIVAHGSVAETGGREDLQAAYAWALR